MSVDATILLINATILPVDATILPLDATILPKKCQVDLLRNSNSVDGRNYSADDATILPLDTTILPVDATILPKKCQVDLLRISAINLTATYPFPENLLYGLFLAQFRWKSLRKLSGFSKRFTTLSQKQFILEKNGPHFRDQRRKLCQKKPM